MVEEIVLDVEVEVRADVDGVVEIEEDGDVVMKEKVVRAEEVVGVVDVVVIKEAAEGVNVEETEGELEVVSVTVEVTINVLV